MTVRSLEKDLRAKESGQHFPKYVLIAAALFCVLLVAGTAFYILVLGPSRNPLDEKSAALEGNTYTNQAMNLCFTLPEGWSFLDEKTMEDLQQAGAEALDAEIPSESGRAKTLMTAMDMTTGTTIQITGSWNSTPAGEMIEEAADMGASLITDHYTLQRLEAIDLGGYSYEMVQVAFPDYGMEMYFLAGNVRDYLMQIVAVGDIAEEPSWYLGAFSDLD